MPHTLLLADDSATIQRVIELTFAGEDIKVVAVSDGDQAIARIQSAPPDIVLADVGMPGKSGYEVAEFVKHTPGLAHIPVVLLTGAFEPVDQAKATAAGCDGVLAKPFEPQIVIGRVKELLGRPGQSPASSNVVDFSSPSAFEPRAASPEPRAAGLEPQGSGTEPKVEDYFDRLDAAFANFSTPSAAATTPVAAPVPEELDWLRPKQGEKVEPSRDFAIADELAAQPEEPAPIPAPEPVLIAPTLAPIAPTRAFAPVIEHTSARQVQSLPQPEAIPQPVEPRGPRALPSIAEAFSVILAAEQNALGVRPEWPTPSQHPQRAQSDVVITDELVERVARRVLEQMSDRVVRETVAQIASDVAERLIREEIERIKASVK